MYEPPNVQLVKLLANSRARGLSFEEAWCEAVRPGQATILTNTRNPPAGAVCWPSDSSDRVPWRMAIVAAKDGFRRAYERRPMTRRERAVVALVEVVATGQGGAEGIGARVAVRSAA